MYLQFESDMISLIYSFLTTLVPLAFDILVIGFVFSLIFRLFKGDR